MEGGGTEAPETTQLALLSSSEALLPPPRGARPPKHRASGPGLFLLPAPTPQPQRQWIVRVNSGQAHGIPERASPSRCRLRVPTLPPPPMSHCLPEGNYAKQRMGLDTVCYQDGAEWKSGPEGPLPETSPESVCAEEERVCG